LQKIFVPYLTDASYPLWWGIAVWPVNSFVKANDFARKTMIPFCTSVLSGLGESGELLAKLAGSGEWKEGMRFLSNASDEEAGEWIEFLEL
jgi:hypothetical protein